jgi:hypothetical protein
MKTSPRDMKLNKEREKRRRKKPGIFIKEIKLFFA